MATQERECSVPRCDAPLHQRTYCAKHYMRWYRHGHTDSLNRQRCANTSCMRKHTKRGYHYAYRTIGLTYAGAHIRVNAQRGEARMWRCHTCDSLASHWAYNHQDSNEMVEHGLPYSADPWCYRPMCVPCHKTSDTARKSSKP